LTIADARTALHAIGYTLSRRNAEYRVAPLSGSPAQREAQAYYTPDLADAVAIARAEAKRRTDVTEDRSEWMLPDQMIPVASLRRILKSR
jgi:hypothetical protein